MRNLVGYNDLPEEISNQIDKVVSIWKKHLKDELVGVYLHGSIALNAFNPKSGDIDILVVVNKSLDIPTKLSIAKTIIEIDKKPCPLEMSAILLGDAKEWKTPGNCVFHYSDFWTEKYQEKLAKKMEQGNVNTQGNPVLRDDFNTGFCDLTNLRKLHYQIFIIIADRPLISICMV